MDKSDCFETGQRIVAADGVTGIFVEDIDAAGFLESLQKILYQFVPSCEEKKYLFRLVEVLRGKNESKINE